MQKKPGALHIVYLVFNASEISGGTRVIFEHVNHLSKRGHHVEIWLTDMADKPYFACDVPVNGLQEDQLNVPDVVVMTDLGFIPMVKSGRQKKDTFLLIQHDNEWVSEVTGVSTYASLISEHQAYFKGGDCLILVVSTWLQGVILQRYGLDSTVIPNGVNPELFHPDTPLLDSKEPVALIFYDPQEWKGFTQGALALLQVKKHIPDLQIAIVGRYFPETPNIEGMSFGLPFPAIYFNRPEQVRLAHIYSSATVFVSASWKEGFGLPGLEAMACGVPVVTTDSLGINDYARDGLNCIVVQPQNVDAIADAVIRVIEDEALTKGLVAEGLKTAKEFNWSDSITKLEDCF
jgi:glycosyltransferase involved in cell wall biosynthesis